jgi:hypothetical protein
VSKKAGAGGGWFTWVFSTDNLEPIASKFGRDPIEGHRTRPNGTDLKWRQIGVREIAKSPEFPFFIEWLTSDHPSKDGTPSAEITKIRIADENRLTNSWFKEEIVSALGKIEIEWIKPEDADGQIGIIDIELDARGELIVLE